MFVLGPSGSGAASMIVARLALLPLHELREHEEFDRERLEHVIRALRAEGAVRRAIAADSRTMVALDGVHRLNALRRLQCRKVPVSLVDYSSDEIVVRSEGGRRTITKEDVIRAALSGPKFPPKSTRHMVRMADGTLVHISKIEQEVRLPLAALSADQ